MAAIPLTSPALRGIGRAIGRQYPQLRSAHVYMAIAHALGFPTHAALKLHLDTRPPEDPDYGYFDSTAFVQRARELSGRQVYGSCLRLADLKPHGAIGTHSGEKPPFLKGVPLSRQAWRNAMVLAINAGIEQRQFTIRADDNRWDASVADGHRERGTYAFSAVGIPAIASVADFGWGKLSIHVALWPTARGQELVRSMEDGRHAGELFASGYLERRTGAWLQVERGTGTGWSFACRRSRLSTVAELDVRPAGYAASFDLIW